MIYFLQSLDGGPVKIGFTDDFPARRKALENHYRRPLAVLATREGGRPEEAALHARFAHLRLGRTEQFQPGPDLMEFIGRPLLVGANPEAAVAMNGLSNNILSIRGTPEWRAWLERFAARCRVTPTALLDLAVAEKAERDGFESPPARY